MSDQVELRLIGLLDHPQHDPYGNPIPGLDELGEHSADGLHGTALVDALRAGGDTFTVTRLGEPLQVDVALLRELQQAKLAPGARLHAAREPNAITVQVQGVDTVLELPEDTARHVFVSTD